MQPADKSARPPWALPVCGVTNAAMAGCRTTVKRKELQDAGEIPIEEGTREGAGDEKKNFALQMIIQAASEQQQQGKDQKHKRYENSSSRGTSALKAKLMRARVTETRTRTPTAA